MVGGLLLSMRPKQWHKNLVVFAAVIFSEKILDKVDGGRYALLSVAAFAAFCLVSGAVYIINDLADRENDRSHPQKRFRPIASGRVTPGAAVATAAVALTASFVAGFWLDWRFGAVLVVFFVMQLAYSFGLKRIVVLDVMVVAAGFALRAVSGTYVVNVEISPWLFVCTILLALFLALGKRRHELLTLEGGGISHRTVLGKYSEGLLDQMIAVATSAAVIAYCLYTIWPDTVEKFQTRNLIVTFPFVLFGIYRYLFLVYRKEQGGAPDRVLLSDLPLIVDIVLWLGSVLAILAWARARAGV